MSSGVMVITSVLFGALFSGAPAPAPVIRATFIGNAAVHLTDGTAALLIDFPYESGAFGYMTWTSDAVPDGPRPLCAITHAHRDHVDPALVPEFCAAVLGPEEVTKPAGVKAFTPGEEVRWNGIVIRPHRTPHANSEHYSYLVEWGAMRLYFTGDTEAPDALLSARRLDAAFVSPWLLGAIDKHGARIDARLVIVTHHRPGDDIPDVQQRLVPSQGQVVELAAAAAKER